MSGVFQNIDPPHPHECEPPPPRLWCGGRTNSLGGQGLGWGVNILEAARHCFVLYLRKYFVIYSMQFRPNGAQSCNIFWNLNASSLSPLLNEQVLIIHNSTVSNGF
jgi:hypothetical protein